MKRIVTRAALLGAASLLGLIGSALLAIPQDFLAMSGIRVEREPSLMSELSAPGGLLVAAALVMALGAFRTRFTDLGLLVGTIVYGAYGAGRIVSLLVNGTPSASIIMATVLEVGIVLGFQLLRRGSIKAAREDRRYAQLWEVVI